MYSLIVVARTSSGAVFVREIANFITAKLAEEAKLTVAADSQVNVFVVRKS